MALSPETEWGPSGVTLVDWDREGEERIMAAALFPYSHASEERLLAAVRPLSEPRRAALFAAAVGERGNRRHRPGRGFEHCDYTFEVVSDYGAFRDLQRHRLLTVQWQELTPALGYEVPDTVVEAGLAPAWHDAVHQAEDCVSRDRRRLSRAGRLPRDPGSSRAVPHQAQRA